MKRTIFFLILLPVLVLLGWRWVAQVFTPSPVITDSPTLSNMADDREGTDRLRSYLTVIEGTWVNEGYAKGVEDGEILRERQADLSLQIDANRVLGDRALIVVSEYCQPGQAEYLHFSLVFNHLELVGASAAGCVFDIPQIESMEIKWVEDEGDTILIYEAREAEYQNFQMERLVRQKQTLAQPSDWHCGLQAYLNDLLRSGQYEIYDAQGTIVSPEEAFGVRALEEEVSFFESYSYFWPGYEELCVRSDQEVVVLGGTYPGAETRILAIEWGVNEIRLFETSVRNTSQDGAYPLQKGELAYLVVPFRVQGDPDL